MIATTEQLAPTLGLATACDILQVPRSSIYRARQPKPAPRPTAEPVRALSEAERDTVHETLNSERFADQAPREVYATLLDEGTYLCSPRTMYRVRDEHVEVRERRNQLRHPAYAKPELLATGPNRVWSWDTLAPRLRAAQVQVSLSCSGPRNGRTITCTSCWISSAAMSSVG
jgi:putative transposase